MKIAYCLFGTYSTGGIERVTTVKANWLAEHGYEVYLVTTGHAGRPPYYPLHPSIKHIDLGLCYDEAGELSRLLFIAVTIRSIAGTEKSWRNSLQISVLTSPWQLDGTKALSSTS